jgi:hypothetical protein
MRLCNASGWVKYPDENAPAADVFLKLPHSKVERALAHEAGERLLQTIGPHFDGIEAG